MIANFRQGARPNQSEAVANINQPIPEFGGSLISDTALHQGSTVGSNNPTWMGIYTLTSTVFDAATLCNISGLAGATIPAGTFIPAMFAAIKLTSGSLIAYESTQ